MKKSNEFTPREMKKLLEGMVSIRDILVSNGYKVPEVGNMMCPFHINETTPAAKYYSNSNSIYCFTDHIVYGPADAMELVGLNYKETFQKLWDSYNAQRKDELVQTLDQVYETKLLFKEPLKQFSMGLIPYQKLCEYILDSISAHLPIIQLLYNISREISEATVDSDDYTYLACAANLSNIRALSSGEIIKYNDSFKYYRYIPNFIKSHSEVILIFNMFKNTPIGCTIRSTSSHDFIDVGNTGGLFYGLCNLSPNFKYGDPIVIVEGPKDCETYKWAFHDKNCMAMMTSNTTSSQLQVLKLLTNNIILANDNDTAGKKAQKEFIQYNSKQFKINKIIHPDDMKDFGDLIPLTRNNKTKLKSTLTRYNIQIENFI